MSKQGNNIEALPTDINYSARQAAIYLRETNTHLLFALQRAQTLLTAPLEPLELPQTPPRPRSNSRTHSR